MHEPCSAQGTLCWCFLESGRRFLFVPVCFSSVLWFGFLVVFFVGGGYDFDFVGFFVNFWDYFCDFLTSPHAEQHSPLQQRMCIGFLSIP